MTIFTRNDTKTDAQWEFSCNPCLSKRRVRNRSWFLSSGTSEQHSFELSMEKILLHNVELPSFMCLIMAENCKPQWKISLSFQILQVVLCCQYNLVPHPCKNLFTVQDRFQLAICKVLTKFLPVCELNNFLYRHATRSSILSQAQGTSPHIFCQVALLVRNGTKFS